MYVRDLDVSLRKIISFLNLDPNSTSWGSMDRYYWGWKKKDFPDSTLQYAIIPFIKGAKSGYSAAHQVYFKKIVFDCITRLVYPNGSCDQSYPHENHPKTFLDVVPVVVHVIKNEEGIFDPGTVDAAKTLLRKGVAFSLTSQEKYGTIANHIAHDAFIYLLVFSVTGEEKFYRQAVENLGIIEGHTNEEGWHTEYLGGDGGYQTRTLAYLTKCLELLKEDDKKSCENLCLKSAAFLDKIILPDGTLYSMFGSRNTALLYPSGIEWMALHYPGKFSFLAHRVRNSIQNGLAIMPLQLEFDNFLRLFDNFLDAQVYFEKNKSLKSDNCYNKSFDLKNFGLRKLVRGEFSVFVHYRYGGSLAVYKNDRLHAKDGGFLIESREGDFFGTKNLQELSRTPNNDEEEIQIETKLFKSIQQDLTPFKLILIRLLNLTVLRFSWMADWFRTVVVRAIIVGKKVEPPGSCIRTVKIPLQADRIEIQDRLRLRFVPRKIYRALYLNLFHMASSRYFHPVDGELDSFKEEKVDAPSGPAEVSRTRSIELR